MVHIKKKLTEGLLEIFFLKKLGFKNLKNDELGPLHVREWVGVAVGDMRLRSRVRRENCECDSW